MELCQTLLESIRYEHWLRFYFMADMPDGPYSDTPKAPEAENAPLPENWDLTARLDVPTASMELSRREEPHLFPLLEVLHGCDISLDGSRDAVFRHAAQAAGENFDDPGFGEILFQLVSNPDFRRGLDAFHGWVQELANGEAAVESAPEPVSGTVAAAPCFVAGSIPTFAQWQAAFKTWEAQTAVSHVTTISPFGAQVQFGSADEITS